MIEEIVLLTLLGLVFGFGLVLASKRFAVHIDERVGKIEDLLPGANCGACGFGGCKDFAVALVEDPSIIQKCAQINQEAREEICGLLGIEVREEKPKVALVACAGGSKEVFEYRGAEDCAAAAALMGGFLECKHGCLGLGDCVRACPFDAIRIKEGRVLIDEEKCTGCGICVDICPRNVIKLYPRDAKVLLMCNSPEPGKVVATICERGCIACGLCARSCPVNAIKMENNLPVIDQELCNGCGSCVEACPRKVITLKSFESGG